MSFFTPYIEWDTVSPPINRKEDTKMKVFNTIVAICNAILAEIAKAVTFFMTGFITFMIFLGFSRAEWGKKNPVDKSIDEIARIFKE